MALGHRSRVNNNRLVSRYAAASLAIVSAWLLLLLGALFTLTTTREPNAILPPLERLTNTLTLIITGWVFLTDDHQYWKRVPGLFAILLIILCFIGYGYTATQWYSLAGRADFNLSLYGLGWTFIPIVLCSFGILLILFYYRAITDAPLKLLFFITLLSGHLVALYQIDQKVLFGDYAGALRLSFLVAMMLLPAVIYRLIIRQLASVGSAQSPLGQLKTGVVIEPSPPPPSPIERQSVQLLKSLGTMLEASNPTAIPEKVVFAALEALRADVGAILRLQDANYADMIAAYDKARHRKLAGMSLNLGDQPTLVNAIERQALRPLFPDRNAEELNDLYTRLDVEQMGPAYFQPLVHMGQLVGVLVVGTPYSARELLPSELELLKGIGVIASSLIAMSYTAQDERIMAEERAIQAMIAGVSPDEVEPSDVVSSRQELEASLQLAREQIAQLSRQVMELKLQLDDERTRLASLLGDEQAELSISQRITALNQEYDRLRGERDRLLKRVQEAEAALASATGIPTDSMMQTMIDALRQERESLLAERDRLQHELDDLRARDKTVMVGDFQSMLARMAEERARLETERNQLNDKLSAIQSQLKELGIEEDVLGLARLIGQLNEQRAELEDRVEKLKRERDILRVERKLSGEAPERQSDLEARLQALQIELKHLAADREVAVKRAEKARLERDDLQAKLDGVKQHRARLLSQVAGIEIELNEMREEIIQLKATQQLLLDERNELASIRDRLTAELRALETERNQLLARAEGDRKRIQEMGEAGVGSLTQMVSDITAQRDQLIRELQETKLALAEAQKRLERLEVAQALEKHSSESDTYQPQSPELLMGLVQELRTPMTSIAGYIDLLLGESAGILGEMQRQFLQRVSANITRLATMIDDLIHITELDTGKFQLERESIDVIALIEDAITNASNQFREKGLKVNLKLEDDLPPLPADRDAVSQIVGQLLTNAYLVSPANSELSISAMRSRVVLSSNSDTPMATDCLIISVADKGGGIMPEDIPRVFARKYKAENPLIAGLGDTGVGLSIAKALTEAHQGKLWVETNIGVGSTFNVALPLEPISNQEGA